MSDILDFLNSRFEGGEAAEVRIFDLYINNFQVRVEVNDHGADAGSLRYSAYAFSPDIPEADRIINTHGESLGNPDGSLRMALENVHWNVFEHREE